jgi:hypothetical protein
MTRTYLIDNRGGVIVDAEGTCANRLDEIAVTETMVERVEQRFDPKPDRLTADRPMARPACSNG